MASTAAAALVWINGFPGTGKLTIAKELQALHGSAILLDNHQLIDPVECQYARDHPEYQNQRRQYRQLIFDEYASSTAKLPYLLIFTDFQSDNDLGRAVAGEYEEAARKAGRSFKPVYLTCDAGENAKRLVSAERMDGTTGKLTDAQFLGDLRARCTLFRSSTCPGLTVDTTHVSPREAALEILAYITDGQTTKAV